MIQVFNTLLGAGGRSPEFPLAPVHWRRDARGALPATTNDTIEVRITHRARRTEIERSRFLASGVIHTASGETRHFNFGLDMRRRTEQTETATVHIKQIEKLKDPLVINFGGGAAQLHSTRFLFDIDSDGQAERLPALGPGSGFLALDKNGDGAIDNGNEWFGAATGDGFAELAGDDADHNGWIDAADPVFGKLRLWIPNGNGRERLASLAEKHIGALYLGRAATPFTMQDGGALLGQVKASGVFLREDGSVGAMQQIDLSSTG
ncbi:MAG TPA: hypothetical protein DEP05_03475 [Betaproteobacteria bacterium]|nr:hypothetical protein [Betaproteobacteria bacterium]